MGDSSEPQSAYDAIVAEGAKRARPKGCMLGRVALLKSQLESCFRPLREREVALLEVASFDRLKGYAERAVEAETLEAPHIQRMLACCSSLNLEYYACRVPSSTTLAEALRRARPESFRMAFQRDEDALPLGEPGSLRRLRNEHSQLVSRHARGCLVSDKERNVLALGESRGVKAGIAEGEFQGRIELILFQLQARFQDVPECTRDLLECTSPERLEQIAEHLLLAETLEEALRAS